MFKLWIYSYLLYELFVILIAICQYVCFPLEECSVVFFDLSCNMFPHLHVASPYLSHLCCSDQTSYLSILSSSSPRRSWQNTIISITFLSFPCPADPSVVLSLITKDHLRITWKQAACFGGLPAKNKIISYSPSGWLDTWRTCSGVSAIYGENGWNFCQ